MNLIDLTGKIIVVTGASSGIGKQAAITLSQLGAQLILIARREDKLLETQQQLEGTGHSIYTADLSKTETIEPLFSEIVAVHGALDGMVYAAGIAKSMPLMQFKPENVQAVFDINFFGFVESVRQISRKGRFQPGMRIVGISSVASIRGDKSRMAYSASKSAMDSAVRCIAKEVADKGICINTIAPAMTATELYYQYIQKCGDNNESNQELLKRQYLGIAQTQDIANAIAFMISPAARFITGITLPVDGGLTTC